MLRFKPVIAREFGVNLLHKLGDRIEHNLVSRVHLDDEVVGFTDQKRGQLSRDIEIVHHVLTEIVQLVRLLQQLEGLGFLPGLHIHFAQLRQCVGLIGRPRDGVEKIGFCLVKLTTTHEPLPNGQRDDGRAGRDGFCTGDHGLRLVVLTHANIGGRQQRERLDVVRVDL